MPTIEVDKKILEISEKEKVLNAIFNLKGEYEIEEDKIKIELPPDRLDILFFNGLKRAIECYLGLDSGIKKINFNKAKIEVEKNEVRARKYFACFVVRNLKNVNIKDIILFQEFLHSFLGKDRKYVAIGIHDLDKIEGKIIYKEALPTEKMVPLTYSNELTLKEILEITDKGRKYGNLIENFEKYPAIYDEKGIISFPPIINSERTKLTENTKNIFVDITGTNERIVDIACKTLIYYFSFFGEIENVYLNGNEFPNYENKIYVIDEKDIENLIGLKLDKEKIKELLERAGYDVLITDKINVVVPFYRVDILHINDIIEDIAIVYGYENFELEKSKVQTFGEIHEKEIFYEKIRDIMIGLGFLEVINPCFVSKKDYDKCFLEHDYLEVINPVSEKYEVLRSTLLPSIIEFLANNLSEEYPQKIFEIGYIFNKNLEEGKNLAFAIAQNKITMNDILSYLIEILRNLKIEKYEIKESMHPFFIEGRQGEIFVNNEKVALFGEINPKVLENYGIFVPIAYAEIFLDKIK